MRLLVISDIHGIKKNLKHINERFKELKCDKLIVLGDLFHGSMAVDYDLDFIYNFLNSYSKQIIVMKGNTDLKKDSVNLNFDVYDKIYGEKIDGINFYFTHGNIYNYNNLDKIESGVLIYGHEHIPYIRKKNDVLCINAGSISLPRGNFKASYLYYNNGKFIIYDIDDNIIDEYNYN